MTLKEYVLEAINRVNDYKGDNLQQLIELMEEVDYRIAMSESYKKSGLTDESELPAPTNRVLVPSFEVHKK